MPTKFSETLTKMANDFKDEEAKRELAAIDSAVSSGQYNRAWDMLESYTRKYYPNPPFQDKQKLANILHNVEAKLAKADR